jgi:hypothetical protein
MNRLRVNISGLMSVGFSQQSAIWHFLIVAVLTLSVWVPGGDARAARVSGLYGAVVELQKGANEPSRDNFNEALSWVLVKVTGLSEAESSAARARLFPNSSGLVQQYSLQADDQVKVEFDQAAVRKVLDAAGMPVWGTDRPLVAVWLAVDSGGGRRYVLSGGSGRGEQGDAEDELRLAVQDIAESRGLPIVLPLVDAQDLARVSFSDLWGDFRDPVVQASKRYGADIVLIGRSRSMSPDAQGVRWTLVTSDEQAAWQGNVLSGPAETATFLSRRLATYAASAGSLLVRVTGVDDLDKYGQLLQYFRSLNIVESAGVARVNANTVEFELVVRGDARRLSGTLNASGLIVPVNESLSTEGSGRLPDMVYAWPESL